MSNYEGNPDIKKYRFKTDSYKPLTERIAIGVTKSIAVKIKSIDNYP